MLMQNVNIVEFKVTLDKQGYYDIEVNKIVVAELVEKHELADAIAEVLKDEYGMVADMINEDD